MDNQAVDLEAGYPQALVQPVVHLIDGQELRSLVETAPWRSGSYNPLLETTKSFQIQFKYSLGDDDDGYESLLYVVPATDASQPHQEDQDVDLDQFVGYCVDLNTWKATYEAAFNLPPEEISDNPLSEVYLRYSQTLPLQNLERPGVWLFKTSSCEHDQMLVRDPLQSGTASGWRLATNADQVWPQPVDNTPVWVTMLDFERESIGSFAFVVAKDQLHLMNDASMILDPHLVPVPDPDPASLNWLEQEAPIAEEQPANWRQHPAAYAGLVCLAAVLPFGLRMCGIYLD